MLNKLRTIFLESTSLAVMLLLAMGCDAGEINVVVFKIPRNFVGQIILVEAPSDPKHIELKRVNGLYTIDVTKEQVVKVRSLELFTNWCQVFFEEPDGRRLLRRDEDHRKQDRVVFSSGATLYKGIMYSRWHIGNDQEFKNSKDTYQSTIDKEKK